MTDNPLKLRREQLGLTQREMSRRCDRAIQQIFNWEHDRSAPVRISERRLALAYEVPVSVMREWIIELITRSSRRRLAKAS